MIEKVLQLQIRKLHLEFARLDLGQVHQIVYDAKQAFGFFSYRLYELLLHIAELTECRLSEQIDTHADRGQRRPQLMRYHTDKVGPHLLQLIRTGHISEDQEICNSAEPFT